MWTDAPTNGDATEDVDATAAARLQVARALRALVEAILAKIPAWCAEDVEGEEGATPPPTRPRRAPRTLRPAHHLTAATVLWSPLYGVRRVGGRGGA